MNNADGGKSAEELKALGNEAFSANEFKKAIEYYSLAIKKEPNNHVYFSNRSASYAGLEQWTSAVDDAKECIRLDPSFIKGYYRLANAQMAQAEYDSAIQTIRQGLLLDNNNSQLMKQLRLAQQQKKVVTAKQHSLATASQQQQQQPPLLPNTDGVMTTLDPATASEYQELQNQYTLLSREYNTIQADVIKSQRETKVADITCQELQKINDETSTACYRSIGKLFVKSSKTEMTEQLQKRQQLEEQNITENTKKLEYMERQLTSIRQNINEIIQKNPKNSLKYDM